METKRFFLPLDEWVYFKIYCGELSINKILSNEIIDIVDEFKIRNSLKSWFFVRYYDPDSHLRIRFRMANEEEAYLLVKKFNALMRPLINNLIVWNIQVETYKREIERYSYTNYKDSENLFNIDSEYYLENNEFLESEENKLFYNLKSTFDFIKLFYPTPKEIIKFIHDSEQYYKNEFNAKKILNGQLSKKYRSIKKDVFQFMNNDIKNLPNSYDKKIKFLKEIKKRIIVKNHNDKYAFVSSHIHLNTNRCFNTNQRFYELITYDFLYRYYHSFMKVNNL